MSTGHSCTHEPLDNNQIEPESHCFFYIDFGGNSPVSLVNCFSLGKTFVLNFHVNQFPLTKMLPSLLFLCQKLIKNEL